MQIQRDEDIVAGEERNELLEEAVQRIMDFNRNCKRRKAKRKDSEDQQEEDAEDSELEEESQQQSE